MDLVDQNLTRASIDLSREELLIIKNVIYEAYVEIGEWEFTKRIGLQPEEALALLKSVNSLLKSTL
jgi:hypothetical protein